MSIFSLLPQTSLCVPVHVHLTRGTRKGGKIKRRCRLQLLRDDDYPSSHARLPSLFVVFVQCRPLTRNFNENVANMSARRKGKPQQRKKIESSK